MSNDPHAEAFHRLVLSVIKTRVTKAFDVAHKDNGFLKRGDRLTITDPLNDRVKIGTVSKTDPDDTAEVSDREAFTAWMAENYPEQVRQAVRVTGTADEVAAVLAVHAPHLLSAPRTEVRDWAQGAVLKRSANAGAPVGPGGEVDVPGVKVVPGKSGLQVRPNAQAEQVITALWQSGRLAFDATFTPSLPSGTEQPGEEAA